MNDVMLDLETMSTHPDAAIISIGAVEFDIATQAIGERFYTVVDLGSSVETGGIMDARTVLWWMQQSDAARNALAQEGQHIAESLKSFSEWMKRCGEKDQLCLWGNGAAFDNVVLASAYKRLGIPQPWTCWNDRCYRTVKAMHPTVKMQRAGTHHNALDDAESQARHLIAMLSNKHELVITAASDGHPDDALQTC